MVATATGRRSRYSDRRQWLDLFRSVENTETPLFITELRLRDGPVPLKRPMPILVSHGRTWVIGPSDRLPVHGEGRTPEKALEDMAQVFMEAVELFCGPEVPPNDPTKAAFARFVEVS